MSEFDDARLRSAMRDYLAACDGLDAVAGSVALGDVVDAAERRALAAMVLHRRLCDLGWVAPRTPAGVQPAASTS